MSFHINVCSIKKHNLPVAVSHRTMELNTSVQIKIFHPLLSGPPRDKPVFGVSNKARLKPVSSATGTSKKI